MWVQITKYVLKWKEKMRKVHYAASSMLIEWSSTRH